jgi:tRNA(adenine34) deaminase
MALADDETFMRQALELAEWEGQREGRAPIGCLIVLGNEVVAQSTNRVGVDFDPTAHAEMVAIRNATKSRRARDLRGATLYTTLQPCGMCTMASIWTRIGRIVYGAERHQVHRMYFEDRHMDTLDFIRDAYREDFALSGGVLSEACAKLYYGPGDDVPLSEQTNI